jgi:tetratricopeptide (TPR) repeat protein
VLEGSVRRGGEQVRINAQLIDAKTGGHLWAERYDGKLDDVFDLQDEINRKIVAATAVELTGDAQKKTASPGTDNVAAYDAFLKGWSHYLRNTFEDSAEALSHFEKAIELDPNYSRAYAAVALTYWRYSLKGGHSRASAPIMGVGWWEARVRTAEYVDLAMKNPTSVSHRVAASMALYRRQYEEALAQADRAIALDPNDVDSLYTMAYVLMAAGRPKEGVEFTKRGMRLDPHNAAYPLYLLGMAHFCMGQLEEAVNSMERALKHNPQLPECAPVLSAAYAHLGRDQEARTALNDYLKARPRRYHKQSWITLVPFKDPEVSDRLLDGMVKAGLRGEPFGNYKISSEQKLTGDEIRELVFGRTVTGITRAGVQYWIDRSKDGKATWRVTPGDPDYDDSGTSWIEGDMLCNQWQVHVFARKHCMTVFRTPGGTPENKDEYLEISDFGPFSFSPLD